MSMPQFRIMVTKLSQIVQLHDMKIYDFIGLTNVPIIQIKKNIK